MCVGATIQLLLLLLFVGIEVASILSNLFPPLFVSLSSTYTLTHILLAVHYFSVYSAVIFFYFHVCALQFMLCVLE